MKIKEIEEYVEIIFYEPARDELTTLCASKKVADHFLNGASVWIYEDRRYYEMIGVL